MIAAIKIIEGSNYQFYANNALNYLTDFSRINVFIGTNNSGKSRFLRDIFTHSNQSSLKIYKKDLKEEELNNLRSYISQRYNSVRQLGQNNRIFIKDEFNYLINIQNSDFENLFNIMLSIDQYSEFSFNLPQIYNSSTITSIINEYKSVIQYFNNQIDKFNYNNEILSLYIPILRGLRPIQKVQNEKKFDNTDSYKERTKIDYSIIESKPKEIYTGLNIHEDVMKLLLGTEEEREKIKLFEEFLSKEIFNERITLIPKYNDDVLHIKIGNNKQFEIYNLGDGLQTLISILFPLFIRQNLKTIVLIEEPESHLHPKWQKLLLNALSTFKNHVFFISTHSPTFINNENVSTYLFKKIKEKTQITYTNINHNKYEILSDLGYKTSDLFQTNYILWVEGPSDKIYFNYWINKIAPELRENQHYSIMFFGGENYKSFMKGESGFDFNFISSINQNFGIVFDSDKKHSRDKVKPEKIKIKELFDIKNNFCWITKQREIENYIPYDVFVESVNNYYKDKSFDIGKGEYDDRCNNIVDKNARKEYKSTIKIPQEIFTKIQKNNDGTTRGIDAKLLRTNIEHAIGETGKNTFNIKKIEIANIVVSTNHEIDDVELKRKLNKLIEKIRKANQ